MTHLDYAAVALFAVLYLGYHAAYLILPNHFDLVTREARVAQHRIAWYREILRRGNTIVAVQTVRNMIMAHTYFGTVALVVMGGVFSYLLTQVDLPRVLAVDELVALPAHHPVALKLLLALVLLLVSFLNCGMGIRVCFNLNFTLCTPEDAGGDVSYPMEMLQRQARHFMLGVRSLYFSGPVFLWLLHPVLMAVGSVMIVAMLYRFDFLKAGRVRAASTDTPT